MNVKQEFFLDSKIFTGFYYRAWTILALDKFETRIQSIFIMKLFSQFI